MEVKTMRVEVLINVVSGPAHQLKLKNISEELRAAMGSAGRLIDELYKVNDRTWSFCFNVPVAPDGAAMHYKG